MNVLEQLKGIQGQGGATLVALQADLAKLEHAVKLVDDVLIFLRTAKDDLERIGLDADFSFDAEARVSVSFVLPVVQSLVSLGAEPADAAVVSEMPRSEAPLTAADAAPVSPATRKAVGPLKKKSSGAKAMKPGPRDYKVGPFTDDEIERIAKAFDAGQSRDEIADLVNRSKISVGMKIKTIKAERAKKPRPLAAPPAPLKLEAIAMPKPVPAPVQTTPKLSADDRIVVAHLDGLGCSGGWTAEKDFEILSGLVTGKAAALLADDLGVEVGDVVARFKALNTKVGDIGHQSRLLRILRQRAGA